MAHTKRWYNIYTDERNGQAVEIILQDFTVNYSIKYSRPVCYFSINVNENFWPKVRKAIEAKGIVFKFTKNNLV